MSISNRYLVYLQENSEYDANINNIPYLNDMISQADKEIKLSASMNFTNLFQDLSNKKISSMDIPSIRINEIESKIITKYVNLGSSSKNLQEINKRPEWNNLAAKKDIVYKDFILNLIYSRIKKQGKIDAGLEYK